MTDSSRVRALADRAAIQDVVARYFTGLDRQDFDRVASCFTSDVVAEYRGRVLEGVDALVDITRGVRRYAVTTHFMGNYLVEVRGDTATAETYATDHLRIRPSTSTKTRPPWRPTPPSGIAPSRPSVPSTLSKACVILTPSAVRRRGGHEPRGGSALL